MSKQNLEDRKVVEVPEDLVRQAVALLSYDAKRGYQGNATDYADRRHGTGRALSEYTDLEYTEFPDVITAFPENLYEGLEFDGGVKDE